MEDKIENVESSSIGRKQKEGKFRIFSRVRLFLRRKFCHENEDSLEEVDTEPRVVIINSLDINNRDLYCDNFVKTSKYNVFTFLPLNLMEQFMRIANVYFLIIACLQQIPNVSPTGRYTTLIPLLFVLTVTALKEAIEDVKRHRQDSEVNNRTALVLRGSEFVEVQWKDIRVGDIVKVENRDFIPADLVLLSSSEAQGMCYIETSNLDGETNLKTRQAIPETLGFNNVEQFLKLTGSIIKCDQPNNRLYIFDGFLQLDDLVLSLEAKQTLLRGAMLRNTKWIYGVAVYTGHDTKVMRNATKAPVKRTNVERSVNVQILFMFILLISMAIVSAIGYGIWQNENGAGSWYLHFDSSTSSGAALSLITFVILYNNLVPISLYVTVEIVKFGQAFFINNDLEMYDEISKSYAQARTSNLNEELGQIEYIFSDKTGTLTCNKMEFRCCSIAGIKYGTFKKEKADRVKSDDDSPKGFLLEKSNDPLEIEGSQTIDSSIKWTDKTLMKNLRNHETKAMIREALTLLAVCHTVIPETDSNGDIIYQASSPDEAALVKAAKYFGFFFRERTPKTIKIQVDGEDLEYKMLQTLEFTNTRKRMSVIVQDPKDRIILYCKGADTVILERLAPLNSFLEQTRSHLDEFAVEGLRTLCLAYVELDRSFYEDWTKTYNTANTSIGNREQELEKAAELVEKNMILLGASAVEDELQEGVPACISTLAQAGIKIWVLTGDKQETAISIGHSCGLLSSEMRLLIVNKNTEEETSAEIDGLLQSLESEQVSSENQTLSLIIDGHTLMFALNESIQLRLLRLASQCKSVICCRVSPLQKAKVVKLVRDNMNAITLAIGDGANDVSMIQASHVGIGISGQEGLQACRASDYSISQFRFLKRLLLVHGRSSYRRISKLILYSFYKNIVLYFTQFWFVFFNGFSGETYYERWTLAMYNVLFTLFPVIAFGLHDFDVSPDDVYHFPELYMSGQRKYHFNFRVFWGAITNGIYHSIIAFAIPTVVFDVGIFRSNGQVDDLWIAGTAVYTCVVVIVSLKLALEASWWTLSFVLLEALSIVLWFLWLLIYGVIAIIKSLSWLGVGSEYLFVPYNLFDSGLFYFSVVLTVIFALFKDYAQKYIYRTYFPRPYHIVQELSLIKRKNKEFKFDFNEVAEISLEEALP